MKKLLYIFILLVNVYSLRAGNPDLFYYVSDGTNQLYSLNRSTNAVTLIGSTGVSNIEAIAYYPIPGANVLYAADAGNFGSLNLSTGAFSLIAQIDGGGTANGASGAQSLNDVDGLMLDGQTFIMWAIERKSGTTPDLLFQIDVTTGQFIPNAFGAGVDYLVITGSGIDVDVDDLAVDPKTGRVYGASNNNGASDVLIEINKYSGLFSLSTTLTQDDVEGLAFSNNGLLYGSEGDGDNRFSLINKSTGAMSGFVSFTGSDVEALATLVADANTVSGTIYDDLDKDGVKDAGELGLLGVTVNLYIDNNANGTIDLADTKVQSKTTDGSGNYAFYYASTASLLISTEFSTYPANYALTTDNIEAATFADNVNFGEVDANNDFGLATGADCDGDGIPNFFEGNFDSDGDAVRDSCDLDSDNDGILDAIEGTTDFDDDGVPDFLDRDSDDDGIPDAIEANTGIIPTAYSSTNGNVSGADVDGNGIVDTRETSSGSGVMVSGNPDSDNDGKLDYKDLDSDNDGILDIIEAGGTDFNGDGHVDVTTDANTNGYKDVFETTALAIPNTDASYETTNSLPTRPNYIDIDSDADGIDDTREGYSTAEYQFPTLAIDSDDDGIIDLWDVSAFSTPITPNDHDNDGTPDYLDLNSDNDSRFDYIEGNDADNNGVADQTNLGTDADNNGLDDRFDPSCTGISIFCSSNVAHQDTDGDGEDDFRENEDFDEDGIANDIDIDDDNDGIQDTDEGCTSEFTTYPGSVDSESGVGSDANVTGAPDNAFAEWHSGSGDIMVFDFGSIQPAGTKYIFTWKERTGESGTAAIILRESTINSSFTLHSSPPTTNSTSFITSTVSSENAFRYIEIEKNGGADWHIDAIGLITPEMCNVDTDGDGVADNIDLDSDGDGIADIIEAGGVDADGNGIVDGVFTDTDSDGWSNIFDPDNSGTVLADADIDADGFKNRIDIDADDDGIIDIIESQPSGVLISPSGTDSDGDGIDDNFDPDSGNTLATPENTDGTDNPDYTDTDSDNDSDLDILEGWDTDNNGVANTVPAGTDADNDGLDDNFDNVVGPNHTTNVTDNGKTSSSYPNLDVSATAERDWREIIDNDNDGISDNIDIDDDNDGILDVDEGCFGGAAKPFTSLGQARTVGAAGVYFFNLNGVSFSTYVDASGYVQVARDFGNGSGNLAQGNSLTSTIRGILNATVLAELTATAEVRISSSTSNFDVTTTNATIISRVISNTTLHQGSADNVINDTWTGTNSIYITSDASCVTGSGTALHMNIGHICGNSNGFHWIPSASLQRETYNNLEIADSESFTIWVRASIGATACTDTDNDGVSDQFDLDSDGDGIADIIEAGGVDVDGNGIVDGTFTDTDTDGWSNTFDSDNGGTALTDVDTDSDGFENRIDIDADNDGIIDIIESQPTGVLISPSGLDSDGDGIDDNFDPDSGNTLTTPENTDGTDNPDYIDTDSDNDGDLDLLEGWDTNNNGVADTSPAGTDADNDGLDDNFDNVVGPNNTTNVTDNGKNSSSYPNLGNTFTTERDWRELPDADNDGISDDIDIDDDNDGILDVDEKMCSSYLMDWDNELAVSSNPAGQSVTVDGVTLDFGIENITNINTNEIGTLNEMVGWKIVKDRNPANDQTIMTFKFSQQVLNFSTNVVDIDFTSGSFRDNIIFNAYRPDGSLIALTTDNYTTNISNEPVGGNQFRGVGSSFDGPTASDATITINITEAIDSIRIVYFHTESPFTAGSYAMLIDNLTWDTCVLGVGYDADNDGIPNQFDLDSDNDGIPDIIEAGGVDTDNDGRVDVATDIDGDGWANTFDPDNGGAILADADKDGDGIANRVDIDVDNDGIADIIEAGGEDANNDGRVDVVTDTDADGWANTFDSDNGGTTLTIPDLDGDGLDNYLDLDSDSDGIIDNVEGQTTLAFLAPLGVDTDNDGWDNRYDSDNGGTAITLSNKESTGNPDYLDDETDGDGLPDWTEGFDDDEDGDALDDLLLRADNFESTAGNQLYYINADDANADNIPDWLEDDDSDNVPNFLDPDHGEYHDTDNDGIIDLYDTDNFGIASVLPDGNNDGEYDFRDPSNIITLPIQLVKFDATGLNDKVQLDWQTQSEINNDYFTIERSTEGKSFESILTHEGAGNSQGRIDYQLYDNEPNNGYNYYRLLQTDFNGRTEVFDTRVVYFQGELEIQLYPNPTKGEYLYLEIEGIDKGRCIIDIISIGGKQLKRKELNVEEELSNHTIELLNGLKLANGIYNISITNEKEVKTLQFIIQ